jgi:hypothetical protein
MRRNLMKSKYLVIALMVTFVIAFAVVINAQASAIKPLNDPGGGVKRDTDCCEGDCCNLSTKEGCVKYDNGKCPKKCSAIGKLPGFVEYTPWGMTDGAYIKSKGSSAYQVCFSGAGIIYRYYYGDWVYVGGAYTGYSGKTCAYSLTGDGVYAFVQR